MGERVALRHARLGHTKDTRQPPPLKAWQKSQVLARVMAATARARGRPRNLGKMQGPAPGGARSEKEESISNIRQIPNCPEQ